ncbi:MAG TPA: hypothetical protein VGH59_10245 [Casimicrobiaceae bacterium]|jgi:hypothetical protein
MTARKSTAAEVRAAFGDLSDAALAGLAGATPHQKERIEQFILTTIYPMHASPLPTTSTPWRAIVASLERAAMEHALAALGRDYTIDFHSHVANES